MATAMRFQTRSDDTRGIVPASVELELPKLSAGDFRRLVDFLKGHLGIHLNDTKKGMLESRLTRRLRELGLREFDEYMDHFFSLEGQREELEHVVDLATTHHTFFFREEAHFDVLARAMVPDVLQRKRDLRVWSAASSTGEEAYTIAMTLNELTKDHSFSFSILGTDVSTKALATARRAIYDESALENVPESYARRYFMRSKNRSRQRVRVVPELRAVVDFKPLNLCESYQLGQKMDIVFVRNIIIYFDAAGTQALLEKVCEQLVPGGYLVLSLTESIEGLRLPLKSLGQSIYRRTL